MDTIQRLPTPVTAHCRAVSAVAQRRDNAHRARDKVEGTTGRSLNAIAAGSENP